MWAVSRLRAYYAASFTLTLALPPSLLLSMHPRKQLSRAPSTHAKSADKITTTTTPTQRPLFQDNLGKPVPER